VGGGHANSAGWGTLSRSLVAAKPQPGQPSRCYVSRVQVYGWDAHNGGVRRRAHDFLELMYVDCGE